MKTWTKRLILPSVIVLVLIQLIRPARTNPPTDSRNEIHANLQVDPAVGAILQRSCNDCHSNRTVWPWYSHVAPASWLVVSDVNRGRRALNFSDWTAYHSENQQKHLTEVCKEVSAGEMPGFPYLLLHSHAKLSAADVTNVCKWTQSASSIVSAEAAEE